MHTRLLMATLPDYVRKMSTEIVPSVPEISSKALVSLQGFAIHNELIRPYLR